VNVRSPGRGIARALAVAIATLSLSAALVLTASVVVATEAPLEVPVETPPTDRPAVPVRIWIDSVGVDLPVVSSDRKVRGNPPGYPLCDVAQYWTRYDLPGAPGTAWIYAHAQPGMFLPLLERAVATDGAGLLGEAVTLQLEDGRLLTYRIDSVKQHATTRRIARGRARGEHRLVLQTSEGGPGTIPKLQMAAHLLSAAWTSEPAPRARPRVCSTAPRPDRPGRRRPQATPPPAPGEAPLDVASIALGAGAVLLGSFVLAWVIVGRRP
jgi:hypothetical protein